MVPIGHVPTLPAFQTYPNHFFCVFAVIFCLFLPRHYLTLPGLKNPGGRSWKILEEALPMTLHQHVKTDFLAGIAQDLSGTSSNMKWPWLDHFLFDMSLKSPGQPVWKILVKCLMQCHWQSFSQDGFRPFAAFIQDFLWFSHFWTFADGNLKEDFEQLNKGQRIICASNRRPRSTTRSTSKN